MLYAKWLNTFLNVSTRRVTDTCESVVMKSITGPCPLDMLDDKQ